jgi:hypothetical protein
MPRRRRTPLPLHPRGSFHFTERTVSVDVSRVYHPTGRKVSSTILHIGRSRGALEFPKSGSPAVEVDAATVLGLVDMVNAWRKNARGLSAAQREPVEIDAGALSLLRTTARRAPRPPLPLEGRPRRCWETGGAHPLEWLWIDTLTGDAVIETRTPVVDARGDIANYSSSTRSVSAKDALHWLRDEGECSFPSILANVAGMDADEIMHGPAEPFALSGEPRPARRRRKS